MYTIRPAFLSLNFRNCFITLHQWWLFFTSGLFTNREIKNALKGSHYTWNEDFELRTVKHVKNVAILVCFLSETVTLCKHQHDIFANIRASRSSSFRQTSINLSSEAHGKLECNELISGHQKFTVHTVRGKCSKMLCYNWWWLLNSEQCRDRYLHKQHAINNNDLYLT